jgi:hypothetical protein
MNDCRFTIADCRLKDQGLGTELIQEADELVAIATASRKTAKAGS